MNQASTPMPTVITAIATNAARQPKAAAPSASGAVASSAPSVPTPRWMPAKVENRSGGNQRAYSATGAIRKHAVPKPSSARLTINPIASCANANAMLPATVTPTETSMHDLGPNRSSATPSGSWVAAKQKK